MCGIVGCVADEPVAGLLLEGLRRVEYRGYDSAGMATLNRGKMEVRKGTGKIAELDKRLRFSELPGSVGLAHCLHPDTLVQLSDGRVVRLADLPEASAVASVDTNELRIVPAGAKKFRHPSPPFLTRVRTASSSLLCSDSHRMFVVRDGVITECPATELREGDLLLRPKAIVTEGRSAPLIPVVARRYVRLGPGRRKRIVEGIKELKMTQSQLANLVGIKTKYLEHVLRGDRSVREDVILKLQDALSVDLSDNLQPVSHSHGIYVAIPESTTPGLIELAAYVLGDGAIYDKMIRIKEADPQLISHYAQRFRQIFGVSPSVRKLRGTNAYVLVASSTSLARWFILNFTMREDEFLASIGGLTVPEIAAFIRGIFDAEGTVNLKSMQVLIRMTSERLIRTLQFLLLRFGIQSSFGVHHSRNKNWKTAFSIAISSQEGASKFLEEIGTSSKAKRRKLLQISHGREGRTFNAIEIPVNKATLRQIAPGLGIGRHLSGTGYLDRPTVARILGRIAERTNLGESQLGALLSRYAEGEVFFERVTAITREPTDVPFLYDLEVEGTNSFIANCLVSHNSRWATHGGVTDENAHPHTSCKELVAVIHNGIIENYLQLKKELISKQHRFRSETDTEVIAHLIEQEYLKLGDPVKAVRAATRQLKGQYAIAVMFQDRPDMIVGARKDAPLIVGVGDGKTFLASDVLAFIEHTDRTVFLDNYEVVAITKDSVRITGRSGREVKRKPTQVAWELSDISKTDYAHYTLKEINEQPRTVVSASVQDEEKVAEFAAAIRRAKSLFITASGTSFHAGLLMKFRLNKEANLRCDAVISGELKEHTGFLTKGSVVVVISQSGETADVLEAVKEAKKRGARIFSIVNAAGSTLARESDGVLLLNCGPEVGVAATKSFTAQVVVANLVVDAVLGRKHNNGVKELSEAVAQVLSTEPQIEEIVKEYMQRPDFYFVARGYQSPVAMEGALKLKELSYIHAEGMPASELKHGTLALIEKGTPVVVVNPSGESHADSLSSAEELKARGADVIGVSDVGDEVYKHLVKVPKVQSKFMPVVEVIPLQLLAYHFALARRNDPDYPRNLAKSVTVK